MFDLDFYRAVLDVDFEKTREYAFKFGEIEYDENDDYFSRYFSADLIVYAIEQYEAGKTTAYNLACWAACYKQLLNAGHAPGRDYDDMVDFFEVLSFEVSSRLEDLGFFYDDVDFFDMQSFKTAFTKLYEIYYDDEEWFLDYYKRDIFDVGFIYSHDRKQYLGIMLAGYDPSQYYSPVKSEDEMMRFIDSLEEAGYTEVVLSDYDYK